MRRKQIRLLFIVSVGLLHGMLPTRSFGQALKVHISTLPGLQFDKVQFAVSPGSPVELTFSNTDDMSHNLLIVKPGRRLAVVEAAVSLAEKGPEKNYTPESDDILWHIPVISPGESRTLRFNAPSSPGAYPYVCTYPGHGSVMYGVMHVSTSLQMPSPETDPDVPKVTSVAAHGANHAHHVRVHHPYDLVAPYFYRAFMPESGLASIAVRLPGDLAYCWDADACKLQYAWSGEFLDNTDFWHGHKNAYAKVLGEIFYRDREIHPLRVGNRNLPPSVRFKGYRIVDQYPEFRYSVNGIEITELIREKSDGTGLERRFRVIGGLEPVWFLHASNDGMTYRFSAGQATADGAHKLTPSEAKEFVVTMTKTH